MVAPRRRSTYPAAGVGRSKATVSQPLVPSPSGIWTTDSSRNFYERAKELDGKLRGRLPQEPVDYREIPRSTDSSNYTLSYEEELHLADHFAFLSAQGQKKQDSVSATVLEEQRDKPGLILRLASNQTPVPGVVAGLKGIINLIQEHANLGKNRELFEGRLLHAIVAFSRSCIYRRLKCVRSKRSSREKPLHIRISDILAELFVPPLGNTPGLAILREDLVSLTSTLKEIDDTPEEKQLDRLKEIVLQCQNISNDDSSNSFEKRLKSLGASQKIYQSAEVRQIDKLGKYWQMCLDFSRRSRQPRTRPIFTNFQLDVLEAPPPRRPHGLEEEGDKCKVHGEVQLVLFYERNHAIRYPPRAIGSSKSACFLCDQFVQLHGKFGISHSHMSFYPKWTVPDSTWMDPKRQMFFRGLVRDLSAKLKKLAEDRNFPPNHWGESRANVGETGVESSIASSVISVEAAPSTRPFGIKRHSSSSSTSTIRPSKPPEDLETSSAGTITPTQNSPIQQPSLTGKRIGERAERRMELEESNYLPNITIPKPNHRSLYSSASGNRKAEEPGMKPLFAISTRAVPEQQYKLASELDGEERKEEEEEVEEEEDPKAEPGKAMPEPSTMIPRQNSAILHALTPKKEEDPSREPGEARSIRSTSPVQETRQDSKTEPEQNVPSPMPTIIPPAYLTLPRRQTKKHHKYRDLPLSFPILPATKSFTLSNSNKPAGHKKVRYTFDLEAVSHGKIEIFESRHRGSETRINTKKMRGGDEVDVRPNKGEEKVAFDMCFGRRNSERVGVVITWHEGVHPKEKREDNLWTRLPPSLSSWWHGGTKPREGRGKERP